MPPIRAASCWIERLIVSSAAAMPAARPSSKPAVKPCTRAASASAASSAGGGAGAGSGSPKMESGPIGAPVSGAASGTGLSTPTLSPRRSRVPNRRGTETGWAAGRWSMTATASARRRLDKDVLATALDHDLFGIFQSTHDVDDALLGLFDLAQAHRATDFHLFAQCLRRARRLIAEDPFLQLFACTAHRQRQVLAVDLAQHALQRAVVQANQIVEDEHQLADFGGQLGVGAVQEFEDLLFSAPVDRGQHVDQELGATDRREVAADDRAELALQYFFDLLDNLRRGAVHRGDPQGDFSA